ncbi:hypothetical protein Tco_0477596 [Tanacetum coccineum]
MISTKAWISLLMLLKDIINAVKDDPIANPKINEATETFTTISSNIPEVLSLVKGFDFSALLSMVKDLRLMLSNQEEALAFLRQTSIYQYGLESWIKNDCR